MSSRRRTLALRTSILSAVLLLAPLQQAVTENTAASRGLSSYVERYNINLQQVNMLYDDVCTILTDNGCTETDLVAAIIFPELMRYSQFRDTIESITTQLLYSSGVDYFNCSIGFLQMKPIFCVDVEKRIAENEALRARYGTIDFAGVEDTVSSRFQRVLRMRNLETQCQYLLAFVEICDDLYSLQHEDPLYRLKILSTAYNCGITYTRSQLEYISTIPAYPFGTGEDQSRWIYCIIATDRYLQHR